MAGSLIQVRVDNELKTEATNLFEKLGIDVPTAIRIFLKRSVQENGIPFSMKIKEPQVDSNILNAMKAMSDAANKASVSNMSLEEINAEIEFDSPY